MSAKHHPSDATLFAYGGGSLSEGHALAVAAHLALCPSCREKVEEIEAVGGALLDDITPSPIAENSLAHVMSRLGERETKPAVQRIAATPQLGSLAVPEPLRSYVTASGGWKTLAPGIRHMELLPRSNDGENTFLLRVAPGTSLARHGHNGSELTIVLSGSYSDELGRFGPGDFAETDDSINHQPLADSNVECVCLIAVRGLLRFNGLAGRVFQMFTKI
jgi:putative transcriptional regulator